MSNVLVLSDKLVGDGSLSNGYQVQRVSITLLTSMLYVCCQVFINALTLTIMENWNQEQPENNSNWCGLCMQIIAIIKGIVA